MEQDDQRLARRCLEAGLLDAKTLDTASSQLADCIASGEEELTLAQMLVELGLLTEQQIKQLQRAKPSGVRPRRSSARLRRPAEKPTGRKLPLIIAAVLLGLVSLGAGYWLLAGPSARPQKKTKAKGTAPKKVPQSVNAAYAAAEAQYKKSGELKTFVAALERLGQANPDKIKIWFRLADLRQQQGQAEAALTIYRERIGENRELRRKAGFGALTARAYYLCGVIRELVKPGSGRTPEDWFYKAVDEGERTPFGRAAEAKLLMYKEEYPRARKALLAVQDRMSGRWDVAYSLGLIYAGGLEETAELKELDQAIVQFTRALSGAPPVARGELWYRRARVKNELLDHKGAIADLDLAIKDSPQLPAYHHERAQAKFGAGRFDAAKADLQQALKLDNRYGAASALLGLIAEKTDKAQAMVLYRQALAATPTLALAAERLGCLLLEQGKAREALGLLEQAVGACAPSERGRIFKLAEKARKLAEKLPPVDSRPELKTAEAYFARGNDMMREGEHALGIRDFVSAIKLEPSNANYWAICGMARMTADDLPGAIKDSRKAIALDAKHYLGHYVLGVTLVRQGEKAQGIKSLNQALEVAPEDDKERVRRMLAWAQEFEK